MALGGPHWIIRMAHTVLMSIRNRNSLDTTVPEGLAELDMIRFLLVFAVLVLVCGVSEARDMKLTIYDDGMSCPSNCDAHVVMNKRDNGTRYAHSPSSTRAAPVACKDGEDCVICFSEADASCTTVKYRGGGPPFGTFDFTPAFYQDSCKDGTKVPDAVVAACKSFDKIVSKFGYDKATNCFERPDDPKCTAVITTAKAAQDADIPKRLLCIKMGEPAFNKAQTDPRERRTNACNYSQMSLGGTTAKSWRLLLPAACRPGTYVDKYGLDCCSADTRFAAENHPECSAFFPH
jgi:hypothetical protein